MKIWNIDGWPEHLNDEVAVIELKPAEIQARSSIPFSPSSDSFDNFMGCVCELDDGTLFALLRYVGTPSYGTGLVVCKGVYRPYDGLEQFDQILDAIRVKKEEITWRRPPLAILGDVIRPAARAE